MFGKEDLTEWTLTQGLIKAVVIMNILNNLETFHVFKR